jgi:catechol 2,3-dioxygenase-like lactoylglutathione lyase family enzyme
MEREHGTTVDVTPNASSLQIDHVASPSFDPAATHRFYTEIFGARVAVAASGTTDSDQRWLVVEYAIGDTQLAFLTYEGMQAPSGGDLPDDIRHVAFNVTDVDELWRWRAVFDAAKVPYRIEYHGNDDPHIYAFDPNGLVLELALPCERTPQHAETSAAVLSAWFPVSP